MTHFLIALTILSVFYLLLYIGHRQWKRHLIRKKKQQIARLEEWRRFVFHPAEEELKQYIRERWTDKTREELELEYTEGTPDFVRDSLSKRSNSL